jgi:hypothetical protein
MTCSEVRARLPLWLYGDVNDGDERAIQNHLAHCPPCRRVRQGLENARTLLDAAPVAETAVDLAAIFRRAAAEQERQTRRWRRVARATVGLAAAVLVGLLLTRAEVRVGDGQLVLRWGVPAAADPSRPGGAAPAVAAPPALADVQERLRVISELSLALAQDVQGRDDALRQELRALRDRVLSTQAQLNQRMSVAERNLDAIYTDRFILSRKGE